MAYYHRLDDLLKYAKKKAYHLEDWRDLSITINNLNKIRLPWLCTDTITTI